MPRIAIANPTLAGGMPRPPVNENGRRCVVWDGGDGCTGSKRLAERKMNQRLLKVPRWKATRQWVSKVRQTLRVQSRLNGSFRLGFGVVGFLDEDFGGDSGS